jgi:uncharacterized membrane protein YeaQ/YmgE (transglycosylase-associated protein family)
MLDGEDSTSGIVSTSVQVIAIVILGLVAGSLITTFTDRLRSAQLLATIAGALATVVLAAIAGWYASKTEAYADDVARLQRRPYVKRLVAVGIDQLLRWLEESRTKWTVDSPPSGMPVYPELDDVGVSDDIVADITRDYPDLVKQVSEFLSDARKYSDEWETLYVDLNRLIQHTFELENPPETIDDLVPEDYQELDRANDVDPSMDPNEFVAEHTDLFARLVLTNPKRNLGGLTYLGTEDYARLLLDEHRDEFMQLRGEDAVADQIDLVHRHLQDIKDDHEEIVEALQEARANYIQQYDIMETELGEIRDGGRVAV